MELPPALAELAAAPERAAVLLDIDGTLAPIVDDPAAARVPDETRAELRRLAGRYAVVGLLTGRDAETARRIVGVDGLVVIGEHGLELDPEAEAWAERLDRFVATVERPAERKQLTAAFHFRTDPDPERARRELGAVARRAEAAGLRPAWGRMVLEVRPPLDAHKGKAVAHLLEAHGIDRALFAGDDVTDLDGFAALDALPLGVKIAVASPDGPPGLREAADLVVDGPAELLELLRLL